MAHGHAHHDHAHSHESSSGEKRLGIAFFITVGYMFAEAAGGIIFNSLALLADAGHMLSDAMGLGLAWAAMQMGKRQPTDRHTFGFKRTEILAALANGLILWALAAVIVYEAVHRFLKPEPVAGKGMLAVAGLGLLVNLGMALLLFRSRKASLNLRGAFLHVVSDAMGSVGAIVAAVVILFTGAYWFDPLVSVFIAVLILWSSWGLVGESVHILMEGVPEGVEVSHIEAVLIEHPGVCCVYDLHVWSIASAGVSLSAHVVLSDPQEDRTAVLRGVERLLRERFGISHTTIQVEPTHEMRPADESAVCRAGTACNGNGSRAM